MATSLKRKIEMNGEAINGDAEMNGEVNIKNGFLDLDYFKNHGVVTVGSRKSELALIQTRNIIGQLQEKNSKLKFKMNTMETMGDKILDIALPKIGEKSLFTKDLEVALSNETVEFLVHSLKDLPTTLPDEMALGAVIERDNPYDCVIFHPKHKGKLLADLPNQCLVGTSSLRRIAQLKRKYDHLIFDSIRGNLNTRLAKLEKDNKYDAIILAKAGVDRMNWSHKIGQIITEEICLYAVGQGAIAVEIRRDNTYMQNLIGELTDIKTLLTCAAERAFMRKLNGGCSTPIGCSTKFENNVMSLRGNVLSVDGKECLDRTVTGRINLNIPRINAEKSYIISKSGISVDSLYADELDKAEQLGEQLATTLIELGADRILAEVRAAIPAVMNIQVPTNLK